MNTFMSSSNHLGRLWAHLQSLVDDVREWVELRLTLVQLEIEERIEARLRQLMMRLLVVVIAGLGVVFGLVALALALGSWLGHPGWGFLLVALGLGFVAAVLQAVQRYLAAAERHNLAPQEAERLA